MRIDVIPNWATALRATTEPAEGPFCGIAIGPSSLEAIVRVGDFTLQAGRVLPLRSDKYQITKIRPLSEQFSGGTDTALDVISHLEVILFTDPGELGAVIPRANGRTFVRALTPTGELNITLPFRVPYVGRRQALFVIHSDDLGAGTFDYKIEGVRYQDSTRTLVRYPQGTHAGVTLSADGTYAFYIGGMDNAEVWDVLELTLFNVGNADPGPGLAHFDIDAETFGEIGAY